MCVLDVVFKGVRVNELKARHHGCFILNLTAWCGGPLFTMADYTCEFKISKHGSGARGSITFSISVRSRRYLSSFDKFTRL